MYELLENVLIGNKQFSYSCKYSNIWMFTKIALSLLSTLESIATPCSVKTKGGFLIPIFSLLDITICDFQFSNSSEFYNITWLYDLFAIISIQLESFLSVLISNLSKYNELICLSNCRVLQFPVIASFK